MSVTISNAPVLGSEGFTQLADKLDEIQMANAAITEQLQCCLANAQLGLDPTSGEPIVSAGGDEGTDVEEPPATDIFGEPVTQPDGTPLACPAYNSLEGRSATYVRKVSDFGANIYCVPGFTYAYANSGNPDGPPAGFDYLRLDDPTDTDVVAIVNGAPYSCPSEIPFDATVEAQYPGDFFPEIALFCPAVEPVEGCDELEATNAPSAYYTMWQQYLKAYKRNQNWYIGLYGAQALLSLIATIESIKLYNQILDKQLDMICDIKDDVSLLARCSAEALGDGTEENPGVLKACQDALLEDHIARIGVINNRQCFSCDGADEMWDTYSRIYKPLDNFYAPKMADKLYSMLCNGEIASDNMESWANALEGCVTSSMVPSIKKNFAPLLDSANCVSNNLNDWRESVRSKAIALDDHYRTTYQTPEKTMIPAVMDMTTCLVQRVCEMRDWLLTCAHDDNELYKEAYRPGELNQAKAALSASTQALPHLYESIQWLECNSEAAMALYEVCYGRGIEKLNSRLFQNASDLAPEIRCLFDFFSKNGTEYQDFWDKCHKDRECRFVREQLDMANELICFTFESITRLDKWAEKDRAMFDDNFRQLEIEQSTDIVYNGNDGSNDRADLRRFWLEQSEELHATFTKIWQPCDVANLREHCALWADVNPLQKIVENANCMKDLSTDAQDAYHMAIKAAEQQLQESCEPIETFDYCIEDKAVLHVRKLADIAEEELFRCSSRYCAGATEEALIRLRSEMAKAEGGAYAAATRWKWWANETLRDKHFAQKQTAIQTVQGLGNVAIAAEQASTQGFAQLLSSMESAITRGYNYETQAQNAGGLALNAATAEVADMVRMLQLWHFWPEMAIADQAEAHRMTQQVYNDAQGVINSGHFFIDAASRDKNSALGVAQNSIDVGLRLSEIGQFHLRQAESLQAQRASVAATTAGIGLQTTQVGHSLHRIAGDKVQNAMSQSIAGAGQGLQASQIGAGIEDTALQQENTTTLNALRHMKIGVDALTLGLSYMSEVTATHGAAGNMASNSAVHLINMFRTGQNQGQLSMAASEACFEQQFKMLCKAKDYVQQNFQTIQASLHGGTSGTLSNTNNLLQSQANQAAGSFGTLGNSLENLIQLNNPTPPFGGGQQLFGSGASTTGTGGFGGFL